MADEERPGTPQGPGAPQGRGDPSALRRPRERAPLDEAALTVLAARIRSQAADGDEAQLRRNALIEALRRGRRR